MNYKTYAMFILAAVLSVGISANMGTVFAGENDESYEVKQKIEIVQDCDQKNVNEDSPDAELTNEQFCEATSFNLNDIVITPPEPVEQLEE